MDSMTVTEILRIASDIETQRYQRETARPLILGKMFHNASYLEQQVVDIVAARLGYTSVDLSWKHFESAETSRIHDEVTMSSEAVDLLITAISSTEMFGEGRTLTSKLPKYSRVPVISLHDDIYHWQSALSHLFGIKKRLGSLAGKKIAISWVYGSTFMSPALAHALVLEGLLSGASIRVVTPSDFPILGRVRKQALAMTKESSAEIEFNHDFEEAFTAVDAIIPLNWLSLDNFNHPERNQQHALEYKDWFLKKEKVSEHCLISTEPIIQSELSITPELLQSTQTISSSWLSNRVVALAASIEYILSGQETEKNISLV